MQLKKKGKGVRRIEIAIEDVIRHYGADLEMLKHRDKVGAIAWDRESALEMLGDLPEFIKYLDPNKKIRAAFYYDPNYPKALWVLEGIKDTP